MDRVGNSLYVSGSRSPKDTETLRTNNIETVVSLTHERPDVPIKAITHQAVPLCDGPQHSPEKFRQAVETTAEALEAGKTVLVHCSVGASRSPAVAGTALALVEELPLDAAFQQVVDNRPAVDPHESLLRRAGYVYAELSGRP